MKKIISILMAIMVISCHIACSAARADATAEPQGTQAATQPAAQATVEPVISAADFRAEFIARLDAGAVEHHQLSGDDAFTLVVNSSIIVNISAQEDGTLALVDIIAQGNASAQSGEKIMTALLSAAGAMSGNENRVFIPALLYLIGNTQGEKSYGGVDMQLEWSQESMELKLSPCADQGVDKPVDEGKHMPSSVAELVRYCAGALPDGWKQTQYLSDNGEYTDVLINIYATSDATQALWDCARDVLAKYWQTAIAQSLTCGRLSLVFYSQSMTPLLSMGISRADALAADIWNGNITTDALIALLERLVKESDALLVKHYEG